MSQDKIVQELSIAYTAEITGYHFYTTAAALVEDSKGRSVFTNLAREELTHIMVISAIADTVKKGMGWVSYEEALAGGVAAVQGLQYPKDDELIKRLYTNQSDTNAVQIGIEIEEQAVNFYTKLLKGAQTPNEKVVLTRLLEMEKGHLKILRWEHESLTNKGFWCGDMEYSVEKEIE